MKAKALFGLFIVMMLVGIGYLAMRIPAPMPPALPTPNGCDTFLAAADKMTALPEEFDSTEDVDLLTAFLETNSEPLALIQKGLQQECVLPMDTVDGRAMKFQKLSQLLTVKFRVAQMEERFEDAADVCLDAFTFAQKTKRNAFAMDYLMALAVEGVAIADLIQTAPKLSVEKRKQVLAAIETLDTKSADTPQIVEALLEREAQGRVVLAGQFRATIMSLFDGGLDQFGKVLEQRIELRNESMNQLEETLKE